MRRFLVIVVAIVVAVFAVVLFFARPIEHLVDRRLNATTQPLARVSEHASELHQRLFIADLHCDALLWDRDLLQHSARGLADLPRLRQGHIKLQVFSMPNAYPLFANYQRTPSFPDILGFAAFANRWPRETWFSPEERVLHQPGILGSAAGRSHMFLIIAGDTGPLSLAGRSYEGVLAILAVEGLHVRDGDLVAIDHMFRAGVRVFGLAHMSDNAVAGSAHGWRKYGLTDFGRRVVARIDSLGGIVDLAHASEQTIDDVLAMPGVRVMVSHTGVDGTCPGERNLSDDQLKRIAERGGVIGVGFWRGATCGDDVDAIVRALWHATEVAGLDAIALGSDFDGAVRTPFDAAGMSQLTDALVRAGWDDEAIARVMGLNALQFFLRTLPAGTPWPIPPR